MSHLTVSAKHAPAARLRGGASASARTGGGGVRLRPRCGCVACGSSRFCACGGGMEAGGKASDGGPRRSPRTTSLWPQPLASPPSPLGNGLPCAAVAAREWAAVGLRFTRPGRLGLSCACAPETDVVACVQVEMFTTLWMWRQEYQHHEQLPLAFNGTWPSWNSDLDNRPW